MNRHSSLFKKIVSMVLKAERKETNGTNHLTSIDLFNPSH